jgi:hypothetical protein
MTTAYHVTGLLQASLFLLSISAVYVQLRHVQRRRRLITEARGTEAATDNLSVFAMSGAFVAFFSFMLLSTATEPFAHYIFWSRIPACILSIILLWEFRRDNPSSVTALLGPIACGLFASALIVTSIAPGRSREYLATLQGFVVVAGTILVAGQLHQLRLLLTRRRIGALSLRARSLNLMKDLSTISFGAALGVHQSWSFILVAVASATVTAIVLAVGMRLSKNAPVTNVITQTSLMDGQG